MRSLFWIIGAFVSIAIFGWLGGTLAFQVFDNGWPIWLIILEVPIIGLGSFGEIFCINKGIGL